jgi:hypothetical protein
MCPTSSRRRADLIIGYAEIMKNGTVRPDDMQDFAARIYDEASRLVALVEDVMKLSRWTKRPACRKWPGWTWRRSQRAWPGGSRRWPSGRGRAHRRIRRARMGQRLREDSGGDGLQPLRQRPSSTREGGRVEVVLGGRADGATLTVRDTGIGIPPEHQARVFERVLPRGPQPRRETGGTGLGLSIVKHSAAVHGAGCPSPASRARAPALHSPFRGRVDALPGQRRRSSDNLMEPAGPGARPIGSGALRGPPADSTGIRERGGARHADKDLSADRADPRGAVCAGGSSGGGHPSLPTPATTVRTGIAAVRGLTPPPSWPSGRWARWR